MSSIHSFKHILHAKKQFILLIMISLFGSLLLAVALFAVTPAMNLNVDAAVTCDNPRPLVINKTLGQSASWRTTNAEWIKFNVQQNSRYRLQVNNAAGLELALYDRCDVNAPAVALRDGQLEFTATSDGEYYLLIKHDGVSAASLSGYQATLSPAAPHRPNFTAAQDVPEAVLRRATEFLEELRGSDLAPEWQDARINPEARILYRPDIQEAAYYEFTVEKPTDNGYEPAGYIQLSSGEHDYLVTDWDTSGMSPTYELAELAPLGATLTEFYRIDALTYVAEYEELTAIDVTTVATDVINIGDLPVRIEGLDAIPEEPFELVTQGIDSDGKEEYEGPTELPLLEESPWESWEALKAGYEEEYAPLLKSLKERASDRWELEKNLSLYGETLTKGEVRTVYGLAAQILSSIQVTGDGANAQYLKQEQMSDNGTLTGVILTVLDEPTDVQTLLPFEVALQYTSGTTETLKYAIANHDALPPLNAVFLPLVIRTGTESQDIAAADGANETAGSWGPWHFYWVDSYGDAMGIRYNQIPRYSRGNTSSCWSGCGATAWAMHFAWVDRRAAANHWRWRSHWGLYRSGGGLGANVVAPLNQDSGVDHMTWEIRGYLGTYCSGSGGATKFTRMIDAYKYVRPRATAGWRMRTRYDPTKLCWFGACNGARNLIRYQIVYRRAPAVIGYNNHFAMGTKYAYQSKRSCFLWICSTSYNRWFYINKGWGGSGNAWVDWDDVHFAGIYYP